MPQTPHHRRHLARRKPECSPGPATLFPRVNSPAPALSWPLETGARPTSDDRSWVIPPGSWVCWAFSFSGPGGGGLMRAGARSEFSLPGSPLSSPPTLTRAGGFRRDRVSAGLFLSLVPPVPPGGSPGCLIKFLRAKEGGGDGGREEGWPDRCLRRLAYSRASPAPAPAEPQCESGL